MSDLSATNCGGGCSCNENNYPAAGLLSFYFFAAAAVVTALAAAWAVIAAASFGFSLSSAAVEAITDSVDSAAAAN